MGNGKGEFRSAKRANKMARRAARVLARVNFPFVFPLNRLPPQSPATRASFINSANDLID